MSGLTCYLNGDYMPHGDAKVPVDDRGFLFADGVYEVIKSYGGYIFTEKEHCDRLRRGLSELRFSGCDGVVEEVMAAGKELLKRNKLETSDATIYIQITRGCAPRAHAFPNPPVKPTVYVIAKPFKMPPAEQLDNGVGAVTHPDQRWARCDIKSISLLPNVLANQKAKEAGCYECLLIRDGNIVEASHSNVFAVLDGALYTHPLDNILPGITRGVIVRRAGELGITLKEAPIPQARFSDITELFTTATTTEVMPIVTVDGKAVGDGTVGTITRKLRAAWLGWVEDERKLLAGQ